MNAEPQQSLDLESSYADVCLPEMMGLATANMAALHDQLKGLPKHWATSDKVLVLVFPSFRNDVEAFYAGTGKCMSDMFQPHQLERIDGAGQGLLLTKLASSPSKTDSSGVFDAINGTSAPSEISISKFSSDYLELRLHGISKTGDRPVLLSAKEARQIAIKLLVESEKLSEVKAKPAKLNR